MKENEILGKEFDVFTKVELQADGFWKVRLTLTHRKTTDGEHWEEAQAVMQAYDADASRAVAEVNSSMIRYLQAVDYDLFSGKEKDAKIDSSEDKASKYLSN